MKDYSRLPNVVWTHASEIGPSGITVFAALNKFARNGAGTCFPSISLLENLTGLSRNTVIAALANLRKCKLITSTSNSGRHNVYQLDGHQDDEPEHPTSANSAPVTSANSGLVSSANSDTTSANSGPQPVQNSHPNLYKGTKRENSTATTAKADAEKPRVAGAAGDYHSPSIEESQSQVLTAMRRFFLPTSPPSQQTVDKLIAQCRERNPKVTMEEIARGVENIGNSRSRNVHNIAGLIINQVPLLFEGEAYLHDKQARQEAAEEAARQEEEAEECAVQREQELEDRLRKLEAHTQAVRRRETQDPTKTPWWPAREWSSKKYRGARFNRAIEPLIFDRQENGTMFLCAPNREVLSHATRLHEEIDGATKAVGLHVEVKIFCDEAEP